MGRALKRIYIPAKHVVIMKSKFDVKSNLHQISVWSSYLFSSVLEEFKGDKIYGKKSNID